MHRETVTDTFLYDMIQGVHRHDRDTGRPFFVTGTLTGDKIWRRLSETVTFPDPQKFWHLLGNSSINRLEKHSFLYLLTTIITILSRAGGITELSILAF